MQKLTLKKKASLFFWASLALWGAGNAWAAQPGDVVINEVAWMGTAASTNDEWIELFNPTRQSIDLTGWTLIAADGSPSIALSGVIPANGFFLLERTDDATVSDVEANQFFSGSLSNSGETLVLKDNLATVIDTANGNGGAWPAGSTTNRRTMERVDFGAPDSDVNWAGNDGATVNGLDASDAPLNGTPSARNSAAISPGPMIVYIKGTGSDFNDGLSAATPFATIQRGLNLLASGAKAVVLGGAFHESVTIAKPVTLQAIAGTTLSGDAGTAVTIKAGSVEVTGFSIVRSMQGVAISAGVASIALEGNAFVDNGTAIVNQGASLVNAPNNWWGCNAGPNQPGCDSIAGPVSAAPWLVATLDAFPTPANVRLGAQLLLDLNHNSQRGVVDTVLARPAIVHISDGEVRPAQLSASLSFPAPNRKRPAFGAWMVLATLGLGWATRLRRWRLVAAALLLCFGLTSCGLFFGNRPPTPQTFKGALRQGALLLELLPSRVGIVQIGAQLDGQTWELEVLFTLGVD